MSEPKMKPYEKFLSDEDRQDNQGMLLLSMDLNVDRRNSETLLELSNT